MEKTKSLPIQTVALCGVFTALSAAGAFIRIPLPPVPITLQLLFTTLAGLLLGSRVGALSVGIYIVLGLAGVPVFTQGGGLGYVLQPTFGYILGFCAGAFVTGWIAERAAEPTFLRLLLAGLAGLAVIYALGLSYSYCLSTFYTKSPVALGTLVVSGFLITLPGDVAKCLTAAWLARRLRPALRRGG